MTPSFLTHDGPESTNDTAARLRQAAADIEAMAYHPTRRERLSAYFRDVAQRYLSHPAKTFRYPFSPTPKMRRRSA